MRRDRVLKHIEDRGSSYSHVALICEHKAENAVFVRDFILQEVKLTSINSSTFCFQYVLVEDYNYYCYVIISQS